MAVCCHNLTLGALSSRSALLCCLALYLKSSVFFFEHASVCLKWGLHPFVCWYLKGEYVLLNVEPINLHFIDRLDCCFTECSF